MNKMGDRRGDLFSISSESRIDAGDPGHDRWAVILAGGDGSRLLPLTRRIAGDDRPKQFCPIINGSTLLDETRRRVELGFSAKNTIFVLTQKHEHYYNDALMGVPPANLIVQPRNAGTTPAILYSLLRLQQINPAAFVAFFPSDHYFSDDNAFMFEVDLAFAAAGRHKDSIILMGIEPDGPDEEYGWIEPDREPLMDCGSDDVWRVRRFWEKPSRALARDLMSRGCLWNSFVMVGAVSAFLKMISHAASEMYSDFSTIKAELSTPNEKDAIRTVYRDLHGSNFSREVLQARPGYLAVMPVRSSKWSDLGSPRRVLSTLADLSGVSLINQEKSYLMKIPEGYYEQTRVTNS